MEDYNITVLVDAKEQYTKQLISILKTCIYQGIKSIYMDAKDICHQDNTPDNVLMIFQDLLSRIPKWSQDIINKEFERISNTSKCDYIDDLLKVVYVSHIKILTIIHSAQKNKKLSLKIPSGSHFIHLCYIECAREFWKDPYLFSDRGSKFEQQKNMRDSENMIAECINETIRKQLPIRNILKDFLNEPDEDIEEEDDIKEPVNKKYLKKLETVVKKELKSSNNSNVNSGIDIELIRQVIREEMNGKPATTTIKKELVDNIIDKIINENSDSSESTKSTESTKSIDTTDTNENDKLKKSKKEVKIQDVVSIIPELKDKKDKSDKSDKLDKLQDNEETINTSLDTILNDSDTIITSTIDDIDDIDGIDGIDDIDDTDGMDGKDGTDGTDGKDGMDGEINMVDIKREKVKPITSIDTIATKKNNKSELFINNIDEINLNLDELDTDECEEINIDDLSNIELTPKMNPNRNENELKQKENTKYIFFNDAK
jgi:hypothetical protein